MAEWVYTFADVLTGEELAILPVSGAQMSRSLNAAGSFSGYVPLLDPDVRALDPWAATQNRRAALHVERAGLDPVTGLATTVVAWSGLVWARRRSASSMGLSLSGATWESWLNHRLLLADLSGSQLTAAAMIDRLVGVLQTQLGGNIGLGVADATGGGALRDRTWEAVEAKTALELIGSYTETQTPIEFRIDVTRDPAGGWTKTLVIGEPKLGRRAAASGIELSWPGGDLLDWTYEEDGTQADTALYGVGGTPPAPDGTTSTDAERVQVYRYATQVGSDELLAGMPLLQRGYTASNQTSVNALTDATDAALLAGLNTQGRWSGMRVRADGEFGVGRYSLGDDATLLVTHPSFPEWDPDPLLARPFTDTVRIVGDSITPGSGTTADQLSWTLGIDGRLATSVSAPALVAGLLRRVAALETA